MATESKKAPVGDSEKEPLPIPADVAPGNLDAISRSITSNMSPPTEAAPAVGSDSGAAGLRDAEGRGFDPELHITDDLGQPVKNARGLLKKRPGRKRATRQAGPKHSHVGPRPAVPQPEMSDGLSEKQRTQAIVTGKGAAGAFFTVAVSLGGEEWIPRTKDGINERALLEGAFSDYCIAKGIADIPPGVALLAALMMYAAPRFTMPKTQSKMERVGLWIRAKLRKGKSRAAHVDPRDDRERKDDAGEAPGA